MGRDPELTPDHPSVIIHGSRYYYGRHPDPEYGHFLLEHAHNGKDYWWFQEEDDLVAFLINLPESADRNRLGKLHPDWSEVTPEQRDAWFEEDRLALRALAETKIKAGTAQSFNMDLDGLHGPHPPQQITAFPAQRPLEQVERQLVENQGYRTSGLSEAGRLRIIEGEMDWTGVSANDKKTILAREIDFAAITPEQFAFVYQDIAFEKFQPADATVAKELFSEAKKRTETPAIRPTTKNLVTALLLDTWPSHAAIVDFGLDTQEHYEAIYYPLREGEIRPEQLDAALGNGPELTRLARSAPSNPHRTITFETSWDHLRPESAPDDGNRWQHAGSQPGQALPTPGQIAHERADGGSSKESRGPDKSRDR